MNRQICTEYTEHVLERVSHWLSNTFSIAVPHTSYKYLQKATFNGNTSIVIIVLINIHAIYTGIVSYDPNYHINSTDTKYLRNVATVSSNTFDQLLLRLCHQCQISTSSDDSI